MKLEVETFRVKQLDQEFMTLCTSDANVKSSRTLEPFQLHMYLYKTEY